MVKNMTQGSPAKLLLQFALPLLIGNVFQQVYNLTDAAIVGKVLGYQALAAVGSTGSVTFLVFGFYFGLTGGLTVVTGQRFGANDPEGVRKSVAASTIICAVFSLISTIVCVKLTPQILHWMNTPEAIYQEAYNYLVVLFYGTWTVVFYGLISSILRALGDSVTPLVFLVISCLLNVALDFMFILVFHTGVAGAAYATVIAQALSGFLCLVYVIFKLPILRLHWCNWNVCKAFYREHLRISIPMAFQFAITAVGAVVLQAVLNAFGPVSIAAVAAASKIDSIAIQPLFSFSMAMAAFAAQNYGARDLPRIRSGVKSCSVIAITFSILSGILLIVFAVELTGFFLKENNPEVVRQSQIFMNINCSFYVILAMLLIYRNVLQGMGYTFVPMLAGVAELILRIFAALVLARCWGYAGCCFAHPLAWMGATAVLFADYVFVMKKLRRDGIGSRDNLVRRTEKCS